MAEIAAVANVAAMAAAFLLDEFVDDDDDMAWEKITVDVNEFCRMGDPAFRWHFRLTKPLFEILLHEIGDHLIRHNRLIRERRPLAHILLMVLWILATPDTFRSVALRFGVYPKEVHDHYVYIMEALSELAENYIVWPDQAERNQIKARLERVSNFPGIIGIMDGMHVNITAPLEEKAAHRNYHHGYSIKVQAVCDDRLVVRDIYIGEAGSLHDARVFRRSPICRNMFFERPDMISRGEHIIADSAYTIFDKVMTPFTNDGHLQPMQRNFNRRLSQVRAKIEHVFCRAQGIWRRVKFLPMRNHFYMVDHVAATFTLHNFRIIHNEPDYPGVGGAGADNNFDVARDPGLIDVVPDHYVPLGDRAEELNLAHLRGEQKRWDICNRLPPQV